MKTEYTTLRNTINQSVQVGCSVYYRLGETVMGRFVSIKRNVNWPGLVKRSQEDLSAVGSLKFSLQNKGTGKGKGTWH